MNGQKNLASILKTLRPKLNVGQYVFCTVDEISKELQEHAVLIFKEEEGKTVIVEKEIADKLGLNYSYVASWITLSVHSALDAVGLTAAFASELTKNDISCNVVAGYYHDHIFVELGSADKALETLHKLSSN